MCNAVQIVTTTETQDDALRIARSLVDQRLAACVQIVGPILSVYRWKGKTETSPEWQCWVKSRADRFEQVEQAIRDSHPYEEPEILAMPVVAGSASYLAWLHDQIP